MNSSLRKQFNLPPTESLILKVFCTHRGFNGYLFVSTSYVCFAPSLPANKIIIPISKVAAAAKSGRFSVKLTIANTNEHQVFGGMIGSRTELVAAIVGQGKKKQLSIMTDTQGSTPALAAIQASTSKEASKRNSGSMPKEAIASAKNAKDTKDTSKEVKSSEQKMSFQAKFGLVPSENLIAKMSCILKENLLLRYPGTMYLTSNYICFRSKLKASAKKIIRLADVESVTKSREKMVISQIKIVVRKGPKLTFDGFSDSEKAFTQIQERWQACNPKQSAPKK